MFTKKTIQNLVRISEFQDFQDPRACHKSHKIEFSQIFQILAKILSIQGADFFLAKVNYRAKQSIGKRISSYTHIGWKLIPTQKTLQNKVPKKSGPRRFLPKTQETHSLHFFEKKIRITRMPN